jgi:hypothetical protein
MIKYPNYTFSVPDKRLYTLYKGITVTPHLLQSSSVSSYGQATFTRGTSCLYFVRLPFTHPTRLLFTAPLWQSQSYCSRRTFGAEPVHDAAPTTLGFRDVPHDLLSALHRSAPDAWRFRPIRTFGAEGLHPSGSPRVGTAPTKQHSYNLSSISVIIKSLLHTQ